MAQTPFNPMETLFAALRTSATRCRARDAAEVSMDTVDGWSNGIGSIEISSLVEILALAGLEIVRTDYLNAMTVLAKEGIRS